MALCSKQSTKGKKNNGLLSLLPHPTLGNFKNIPRGHVPMNDVKWTATIPNTSNENTIAQWIIYNGSRTHCFFAEMLTSQNSTFVYESVRRQSNSPKPYKNMASQLLILSWCHISVFLWWIILDIFIVATDFFSCVAQNNVFDFLMTYQSF